MGGLRTYVASFCLVTQALTGSADDLSTFAICTGRLSALMEHQWLMQDPGSDLTEARRDAFADLVQAVETPGQARRALALRIEAKAAMASALQAADLGHHPQIRARLTIQLNACLRLLPQT